MENEIIKLPVSVLDEDQKDKVAKILTDKINETDNPVVKALMEDQFQKIYPQEDRYDPEVDR